MITKENLLQAQFQPYTNPVLVENNQYYAGSFQKTVLTKIQPERIKFFINLDSYDLQSMEEVKNPFVLNCMAQFKRNGSVFNIEYLIEDTTTIEQIEELLNEAFEKLGCSYTEIIIPVGG